MTSMQAATLYAGLFCLFMLVLKANVGRVRTQHKVGFALAIGKRAKNRVAEGM